MQTENQVQGKELIYLLNRAFLFAFSGASDLSSLSRFPFPPVGVEMVSVIPCNGKGSFQAYSDLNPTVLSCFSELSLELFLLI